jgi:hypothetical protein
MAPGESQDCSWVTRRWEAMSRFVCFLYSSNAAVKIVSKFVMEEVAVDGTWDMGLVKCLGESNEVVRALNHGEDYDR